jgi:pimeloyl-ACP methyl ester carboxylesterase
MKVSVNNGLGKWVGFSLAIWLWLPCGVAHAGSSRATPGGAQLTIGLLDPVPTLLSGAHVTTNINMLATKGRSVQGAGTDGITQIVIRFAASQAGQQYTVTLLNDQGQQSTSVVNDGGLGPIGSTAFTQSQIAVTGVSTSQGPMAFAIYQSPIDFPRPSGQDAGSTTRMVTIQVQASGGGGSGEQAVTLLRPLVFLVHGLWGEPSDFNGFTPFIDDPRWITARANYSLHIGSALTSYTPSYPAEDVPSILKLVTEASLGYSFNAPGVLNQASNAIAQFKNGTNPAQIPIASVQADFVCHSMGGLVTRWFAQLAGFLSNATFAQGLVHKVVTIGSPHLGSPLATDLLEDDNSCTRDLNALLGNVTFATASHNSETASGAVNDLQGDGFGGSLSAALQQLQNPSPHPFPFALIQGLASQSQFNAVNNSLNAHLIRITCSGDPLADDLTGLGWPTVFQQGSDTIVPALSTTNGNYVATVVNGVVHSDGAITLGFGPPAELDAAGGIPDVVEALLNTNLTTSTYVYF